MNRLILLLIAVLIAACSTQQPVDPEYQAYLDGYHNRGDSLVSFLVNRFESNDYSQGGYNDVAANLRIGGDMDWNIARIDSLVLNPSGDLFLAWQLALVMGEGQGKLPAASMQKLRDLWQTYHFFRGDTENHHVIYYTSLYIVSEMYIDDGPETWFNGRSARENLDDAVSYLHDWVHLTTTIGQGEYDSPGYLPFFVGPVANLYSYARDPEVKELARKMLDLMIADYAAENLDGVMVASRSRSWEAPAQHPWRENPAAFAHLIWGQGPGFNRHETMMLYMSGWQPSDIIWKMGTDRSQPYEQIERKRTRHRIRYNDGIKNAPVYKYTWITPDYGMASAQGGLLQPIQQRTWMIHWRVDEPNPDLMATFFALHPYSSPESMQMYFSEHREMIVEMVARSKLPYDSPDKLVGESPYEQITQYKDALVALYDIPEGTRFPFISTFFSADLEDVVEDVSGWIVARGNRTWIGYFPLGPRTWYPSENGSRRLQSDALKNGYIVQLANTKDYPDVGAFIEALKTLSVDADLSGVPKVNFTALDGTSIELEYDGRPKHNGVEVDYENWPLYRGPFINETGPKRFELRYGDKREELRFDQ